MGRPTRGSRQATFYTVNDSPSLATLDSAFQLQEYIALLVRLDPHDVQRIVELPGSARKDADPESPQLNDEERPVVDEACWIYEQLRRLAQDLTHPLITTLQEECTRQTCPEMKAGEWLYLCVAHGNSGGMEHCCAIDYIVHTLDSATALLNSPRAFPSRISIPPTSHRHFPSLARRLGRIFAHAYHHHRAAFESAEAEGALYARFLALARRFDLVPAEFLVIPPKEEQVARRDVDEPVEKRVTLLTRESPGSSPRMGGRTRTDTMYLPGGFVSGGAADSPRRIPSPMAGTLFTDSETVKGEGANVHGDVVASVQPSVPSDPAPALSDPSPPTAPPSSSEATAVPSTNPDKSRVLARDFAIPGSHQFLTRIDMHQGEEGSDNESEKELAVAEEETPKREREEQREEEQSEEEQSEEEQREEEQREEEQSEEVQVKQVEKEREEEREYGLGEGEEPTGREQEEVETQEKDEQDPAEKETEDDAQPEDAESQVDVRHKDTGTEGRDEEAGVSRQPDAESEPEPELVVNPAPTAAPIDANDVVESEEKNKEEGSAAKAAGEAAGAAKRDADAPIPESDEKE